jgi:MinD-like ATPase involved in chromosome partitioning or flagellar assembly
MADDRNGQVITFYSYKGGTGRTMAIANVAWILACNGRRVLMVDWDLESPGLDRFFTPFMDPSAMSSTNGVIELIREYEWAATRQAKRDALWYEDFARVHKYSFSLAWPHFPGDAALDFLSAGRQNRDYAVAIAGMNWDDFYERQGGGTFFDALRADMKRHYDYTLIDSRTGLSDVADICTIHLPDILVDCFTLSEQCIDGAVQIADLVRKRSDRAIRIFPVPMRVDSAEQGRAEAGRLVAQRRFASLPDVATDAARDEYWAAMQIPYRSQYGYEESLAAFGDLPGESGSLLAHYQILAGYLTDGAVTALPPMEEAVRRRVNEQFVRRPF